MNYKTQVFVHKINTDTLLKKIVSKKIFWLLFCAFGFIFPIYKSLNRELPPELPILFQVPEFQLVNENGAKFGSVDLKGRAYIASFIFTQCPSSCPGLMETMQVIQKRVRGLGTQVALVTFTVDPDHDTPSVLFKYARELKANPHVWNFLTGPTSTLKELLIKGFKVPVGEKEQVNDFKIINEEGIAQNISLIDIAHSQKFALVDSQGQIRGYYSSDKTSIDKLMIDLGLLLNRKIKRND